MKNYLQNNEVEMMDNSYNNDHIEESYKNNEMITDSTKQETSEMNPSEQIDSKESGGGRTPELPMEEVIKVYLDPGLEKTRVFYKKPTQMGFL